MKAEAILTRFGCCFIPIAFLFAQACSYYSFKEDPVETEALKNIPAPYSLAIMPVANHTKKDGLGEQVRLEMYRSLSPLNYADVEMSKINEAVIDAGIAMRLAPNKVPTSAFQDGKLADSLLYAEVENLSKVCLLFFGQIKLNVKMKWVDSRTGETLYTNEAILKNRKIILPTSLSGLASILTVVWFSLDEKEVADTIEEFGERIERSFPNRLSSETAIAIDRIELRFPGKKIKKGEPVTLVPGDALEVEAVGTMGQTCAFEILSDVTGLAMQEDPPGVYKGRYTIVEGDTCEAGVVRVTMKAAWGAEDSKSELDAGYKIEAGKPRAPAPKIADKDRATTGTVVVAAANEKPAEKPEQKPEPPQTAKPEPSGPKMKTAKWVYQAAGQDAVELTWEEMGSAFVPPLRANDTFWLEFESDAPAYLYVFNYDTGLELNRLFPLPERDAAMQNPLPAGKKIRVPSEGGPLKGRFTLAPVAGNDDLKEAVLVLLSAEPREDLDALYETFQKKEQTVADKTQLLDDLKALVAAMLRETPAGASKRLTFVHQK